MNRFFTNTSFFTLCTVACAIMLSAGNSTAFAQTLPVSLRVSSAFALSLRAPAGLALAAEKTPSLRRRQHRASWMIASGAGLLVGGVVHAASFGRKGVCYERDQRLAVPAITGGFVATLGLGLLIGGGVKLANVPEEYRSSQPASGGGRARMILAAVGIAALTQGVLFLPMVGEYVGCISS